MSLVTLPEPSNGQRVALSEAFRQRRSLRDYTQRAIPLAETASLLWAAQGINHPSGLRTAPSAGALYPLELLLVAGNVAGLDSGLYRYRPAHHQLERLAPGDLRHRVAKIALQQTWIAESSAVLVITAVYERSTRKYGHRAKRYVHIEVGHAAQNALLQAAALGLAAAVVGAFDDAALACALELPASEHPLYLLPVGWPADGK